MKDELSAEDREKFRKIYLENKAMEDKYNRELEEYYKSKGFETLEEYKACWKKREDEEHKAKMKEYKRIYDIYSKGGYLTIR